MSSTRSASTRSECLSSSNPDSSIWTFVFLMKQLDVESLSSGLSWKQFEALTRSAFETLGYEVKSNYRLKKPRIEIDLLALRGGRGFAIDCKHWGRTVGSAMMRAVAEKQIARSKYALRAENLQEIMPMLVTLHDEGLQILDNGVPVVPISKLSDFALNWEVYSGSILRIRKRSWYA